MILLAGGVFVLGTLALTRSWFLDRDAMEVLALVAPGDRAGDATASQRHPNRVRVVVGLILTYGIGTGIFGLVRYTEFSRLNRIAGQPTETLLLISWLAPAFFAMVIAFGIARRSRIAHLVGLIGTVYLLIAALLALSLVHGRGGSELIVGFFVAEALILTILLALRRHVWGRGPTAASRRGRSISGPPS